MNNWLQGGTITRPQPRKEPSISQGSVAARWRCDRIFNGELISYLLLSCERNL